jgi:hypothetical protein
LVSRDTAQVDDGERRAYHGHHGDREQRERIADSPGQEAQHEH